MKKIYIVIILLAFCVFKPNNSNAYSNKTNVQDSLALVDLYNSAYGPIWNCHYNWLTSKPVSSWCGVSLDGSTDTSGHRVTYINLSNNNLKGFLPLSFGKLTHLVYLYLNDNQLVGDLPETLDSLKSLQYMNISNNRLNGNIAVLDSMPKLNYLNLSNNQLTGSIAASFKYVPVLYSLYLNNNQLSGDIPSALFSDSSLLYFYFNNNRLSGSIPKELGNAKNLVDFDLSFNNLSGNIPAEIGNLKINILRLNNNQLSDTIPGSLGTIGPLTTLDLSHNHLTGSIPGQICRKKGLINLYLDFNQLSGSIPNKFINGSLLKNLFLNQNNFTGTIPKSIGNLKYLEVLFLSHNNLTGTLPDTLRNLKILLKLQLADNELKGTLPSFLTAYWYLDTINIERNHFTFAGLEPLVQHNFNSFLYDNQRIIFIHQHGDYLAVNAGGTLTKNTYKWYNGNTLVATIIGDSTYTPTASGTYSVQVINSVCTALTLNSSDYSYTLAPFNQQNIASIQSNNKTNFSIYPNPAHDFINVYFSNATAGVVINVYDVNGKKLITQKAGLQKGSISINISSLASGVYFIEAISDDKIMKQKFVKQ